MGSVWLGTDTGRCVRADQVIDVGGDTGGTWVRLSGDQDVVRLSGRPGRGSAADPFGVLAFVQLVGRYRSAPGTHVVTAHQAGEYWDWVVTSETHGATVGTGRRCREQVTLAAAELDRLAGLPRPANELTSQLDCELEGGHAGPHHALAQCSGEDDWWLRWGDRLLVVIPVCPAEKAVPNDDPAPCTLPAEHSGRHCFDLD